MDADCSVEDDKIILTMSGGKAGTVQIKRLIKDNKLHVEQVENWQYFYNKLNFQDYFGEKYFCNSYFRTRWNRLYPS